MKNSMKRSALELYEFMIRNRECMNFKNIMKLNSITENIKLLIL